MIGSYTSGLSECNKKAALGPPFFDRIAAEAAPTCLFAGLT
jgi:hypothetical protein